MRKIITIVIAISVLSCKAQNIVSIESNQDLYVHNSGNYYKDTNNEFNKYEGTWKFENNNTSLTLKIRKLENVNHSYGYLTDELIGEFQYIENGIELINTLSFIDDTTISWANHHISGSMLISTYSNPICDDCNETEKRVRLYIENNNNINTLNASIVLRYVNDGVQKIELTLMKGNFVIVDETAPQEFEIPFGNYTLIKQ